MLTPIDLVSDAGSGPPSADTTYVHVQVPMSHGSILAMGCPEISTGKPRGCALRTADYGDIFVLRSIVMFLRKPAILVHLDFDMSYAFSEPPFSLSPA